MLRVPLFLTGDGEKRRENWGELKSFRRGLTTAGNPPVFVEGVDSASMPLRQRAQLWGRIEGFLRQYLDAK